MAGDLELDGALHVAEGVQVLQLGLDAEGRLPARTHRDVRVAAQAPLLHVPVVDADRDEDFAHAAEGFGGVGRRPQVGLGHDLDERHAAAVEIQVGGAGRVGEAVMERLAGVLLHVHAGDADGHDAAVGREADGPARRERPVVLRDLIPLGQIGIEVVLPREDRLGMDAAAQGQGGARRELHGAAVQDGQRTGKPETHGTERGIGLGAEPGGAAAENLGGGQQLRVNLQADNRLKFGHASQIVFGNLEIG